MANSSHPRLCLLRRRGGHDVSDITMGVFDILMRQVNPLPGDHPSIYHQNLSKREGRDGGRRGRR